MEILALLFLMACLAGYFIPFIVALVRDHNISGVFIVNLLTGWTFLGWIIALVMACGHKTVYIVRKPSTE